MKKILTAVSALLITAMSFAATEIDIQTAIKMADENNYEIKNAKKDLENYQLQVKEAYKEGLPKLSFKGIYTKLEEKTNAKENSDEVVTQQIVLTQPIFMGGMVWTGIKSSKKAKNMADYTFEKKQKDVKVEVEQEYIGILKLQKQKEIIETSLKKLKEDRIKIGVMYDLNIVSKSSLLDIDYSISQIETSLTEVENGIEISKLQLKNTLGIAASEEINLKEIFTEGKYSDKISIEDDVKYTLDNNLNIKILKASTSLQEDSEVIKRAALLPTVAFQFDYGVSSKIGFNEAFKSENQSWNATIAVNYDIFSWGENLNKLQRAKNETAKAKESEKNSITNIEIAVRNSYLNLLKYDKMIDSKNKSYLSAKENYEIYKEKLDVGIISTTDFLTAESNLRKAEIDYKNTELEYYLAYLQYNNLVNRGK